MPRVGFLFDYRSDQVWHALPIACELSIRYPDVEVICLTASPAVQQSAQQLAKLYPGHRCRIQRGHIPAWGRLAKPFLGAWLPIEKQAMLYANDSFYRSLDLLVAPDVTSARIRNRHGLERLPMILTRHGAGDRAGSFRGEVNQFDLVFVPGTKTERDLIHRGLIGEDRCRRIGYPKFAAVDRLPRPKPIFKNHNPVILYNPHFDPDLSSWYRWGPQVLDFFAKNPHRYNLIFAPHVKLFGLRGRYKVSPPSRYYGASNIHIDLGSPKSVDMTYTRLADFYLGDVSSQIYEFIRWPRPCAFLNAAGVDWRDDAHFRHWHLGEVVESIADLDYSIEHGLSHPLSYQSAQEYALRETFDTAGGDSAIKGADAIDAFLRHQLAKTGS